MKRIAFSIAFTLILLLGAVFTALHGENTFAHSDDSTATLHQSSTPLNDATRLVATTNVNFTTPTITTTTLSANTNASQDSEPQLPEDELTQSILCPVQVYYGDHKSITELDPCEADFDTPPERYLYGLRPQDPGNYYVFQFQLPEKLHNKPLRGQIQMSYSSIVQNGEIGVVEFRYVYRSKTESTLYHGEVWFVADQSLALEYIKTDKRHALTDGENLYLCLSASEPDGEYTNRFDEWKNSKLTVQIIGDDSSVMDLYETDLTPYLYPSQT